MVNGEGRRHPLQKITVIRNVNCRYFPGSGGKNSSQASFFRVCGWLLGAANGMEVSPLGKLTMKCVPQYHPWQDRAEQESWANWLG